MMDVGNIIVNEFQSVNQEHYQAQKKRKLIQTVLF